MGSLLFWASRYISMEDLLAINSCRPAHPVRLPRTMEQVNTPLDWRAWDGALAEHPDPRFRRYIIEGIRDGFRIGFNHKVGVRSSSVNMGSAMDHPEVVGDYLAAECSEGRAVGPLDPEEFPYVHTSHFGVIPKYSPDANRWRLIVDLSALEGASINEGIDSHLTSLSYVGVKDASRGDPLFRCGSIVGEGGHKECI